MVGSSKLTCNDCERSLWQSTRSLRAHQLRCVLSLLNRTGPSLAKLDALGTDMLARTKLLASIRSPRLLLTERGYSDFIGEGVEIKSFVAWRLEGVLVGRLSQLFPGSKIPASLSNFSPTDKKVIRCLCGILRGLVCLPFFPFP